MPESSPLTFLLGVVLGFIARPVIMGCFSSKPEPATYKPPITQTVQQVQPVSDEQPLQQPVKEEPILSVPRPTVTYGDRERNELKVKNLRDKLETTISTSEQVLRDEARIAVRLHREGNKTSARILLRRRQLTQKKISNCQNMLFTVMEMLDSMDLARDNAKFVESVKSGTNAINDIMKDMNLETVHQALDDARRADEYTKQVGAAMEGEHVSMDDAEFESVVAEMTEKYGVPEEQPEALHPATEPETVPANEPSAPIAGHDAITTTTAPNAQTLEDKISAIPKPPTDLPLPPPTPELAEEEPMERVPVAM